jgi:hypothetical protein
MMTATIQPILAILWVQRLLGKRRQSSKDGRQSKKYRRQRQSNHTCNLIDHSRNVNFLRL